MVAGLLMEQETGRSPPPRATLATLGESLFSATKPDWNLSMEQLELPESAWEWVRTQAALCQPRDIRLCDGSEEEAQSLLRLMQDLGMVKPLPKYHNCWLARTNPADVARVESKTVIVTPERGEVEPKGAPGVASTLGRWMSPDDFAAESAKRWPGCMRGRTMYVLPFSMGPPGSPLAKTGIQLTDSPYVVASMRVMTHMGPEVLASLFKPGASFVKCLHSVGTPLPLQQPLVNAWPCNPSQTLIAHLPHKDEIISFGSGYGGNSLLGKKCFALRLGSRLGKKEGWLAEHMLIIGVTPPSGNKRYIAAAFPSACGKTNLAMMLPTLPGYKVECVGDDIAWMKFDDEGVLRAINPENGFFGVAPGTSMKTNPIAMQCVQSNTIFTNVAETSDGGVYWEGMEKEVDPNVKITDWLGEPWEKGCGRPAAHPNSRFCTPLKQLPILDPGALDPQGVPIDAILFGGRRPHLLPLVLEARDWSHGVLTGAAMRSQATAAAEFKGTSLMNDPFAMRPFFGYNFGSYLQHWLNVPRDNPGAKIPKIFQVNWFRRGPQNEFLWPGFGENIRVLDWILKRLDDETDSAVDSPIGRLPAPGSLTTQGSYGENIRVLDWILKRLDNETDSAVDSPIGRRPAPGSLTTQGSYGENIRVLDWILKRLDNETDSAVDSPIGRLPAPGSLTTQGSYGENIRVLDWILKRLDNETDSAVDSPIGRRPAPGSLTTQGSYGENIRVLDWILKRLDNETDSAVDSPIGRLPAPGSLTTQGSYGENIRVLDWILKRLDNETDSAVDFPIGRLPAPGSLTTQGSYGENIRVLDWILKRLDNETDSAVDSPIGRLPAPGSLTTQGPYGENIRVLDWILKRLDNETDSAVDSPIGPLPAPGSLTTQGLKETVDWDSLFHVDRNAWLDEIAAIRQYFQDQVGEDMPSEVWAELDSLESRLR